MEEIEGVFFGRVVAVFHVGPGVHVGHADVVGSAPFEEQLVGLDVDLLEQAVLNPAAFAELEVRAVGLAFVVDCDEGSALGGDAKLVGVAFEVFAVGRYSVGDFVGGVELEG